jgi:hypothetical protein
MALGGKPTMIIVREVRNTTHALSSKTPSGTKQSQLRYYSETPTFYGNYLAMSNTANVRAKCKRDRW